MSQPKRYTVTIPAEVWEMSMQDAEKLAQVYKECVRLTAENERLRKAAQAVYDELHKWGDNSPMVIQNLMDAINAAKEGRDAK